MPSKLLRRSWPRSGEILLLVFFLFSAGRLHAQGDAWLFVETNLPESVVVLDGIAQEAPTSSWIGIPPGNHLIGLVPPEADSWSYARPSAEIVAREGDSLRLQLDFPYQYRIETMPYGALVWLGAAYVGRTPLLYSSEEPVTEEFLVEMAGFVLKRLAPGGNVWNSHFLMLEPSKSAGGIAREISWEPPRQRRTWIDYATAGATLAAGAVSVHYKFKADRIYSGYLTTGDPELRTQMDRYDTRAAWSLGAMQVGLGVLAFRFVIQ